MAEDEYELVPLSPIRKMDKRIERLEKNGTGTEIIRELIEVVKTNQQIVDDVVRINSETIKNVSSLADNINRMTSKIDEFMNRIETTGDSTTEEQEDNQMQERLDKIEKKINSVLTAAARRPTPPTTGQRRTRPLPARQMRRMPARV